MSEQRWAVAGDERLSVTGSMAVAERSVRDLVARLAAQQQAIFATLEQLRGALERSGALRPVWDTVLPPGLPAASGPALGLASPGPRVAVYCLGDFRLLVDDQPVEVWPAGRARALFQFLVNSRNRFATRERLVEALWPNPEAVAASTSLKVAAHALRRLFRRLNKQTVALDIVAHGAGYQLSSASLWLDVEEFERACAWARRLDAEGRQAEAAAAYARAADLYRGDFLDESTDEWAILRRESLKDQYLLILARLAEIALTEGDYGQCIRRCQQLLEHDRCREDAYRTLILCHARLGQRGRVRRWYELCVSVLRAELDAAPEPETEALYHSAVAGRLASPSLRLDERHQVPG